MVSSRYLQQYHFRTTYIIDPFFVGRPPPATNHCLTSAVIYHSQQPATPGEQFAVPATNSAAQYVTQVLLIRLYPDEFSMRSL